MTLFGALAERVRQGKQVITGSGALAAGSLVVNTKFATIDSVQAIVKKATAPTSIVLTWNNTGGAVTIYAWKVTASGDTTLIADTGTDTVSYVIVGRDR